MSVLCRIGIHKSNYTGDAFTFAPQRIRCERCGKELHHD